MEIWAIFKHFLYLAGSRKLLWRSLLLPVLARYGLGVAIFAGSIWWGPFPSAKLRWICRLAHDLSCSLCIAPVCSLGLWILVSPPHMVNICLCCLPAIVLQGQVPIFLFLPPGCCCSGLPLPLHFDMRGSLPFFLPLSSLLVLVFSLCRSLCFLVPALPTSWPPYH